MSFDLSTLEPVFLYRMGTDAWAHIDWLTEAELYTYFDEAAKRLAQSLRVFIDRDTSTALVANVAQYPAAANWISTLNISVGNFRLRPASVAELLALDSTWQTTPCAAGQFPSRYSDDAGPLGTVTIYPLPQSDQAGEYLAQVYHRFPATITASQTTVTVPAPVADYFTYAAAQRARSKESDGAMAEMAAHFEERAKLYEQVISQYWGDDA